MQFVHHLFIKRLFFERIAHPATRIGPVGSDEGTKKGGRNEMIAGFITRNGGCKESSKECRFAGF